MQAFLLIDKMKHLAIFEVLVFLFIFTNIILLGQDLRDWELSINSCYAATTYFL